MLLCTNSLIINNYFIATYFQPGLHLVNLVYRNSNVINVAKASTDNHHTI